MSAGVATAGEARDPWKNLRNNDDGPNAAPAERNPQAAGTNVLETTDATYVVGEQDLNDNLDILLDRSYGATPARERDFIAGIDGLAGGKKWRPHVEFTAAPGNKRTMGQVNLFAPLMQDSDSLFYADLRASAWTTDVQEGNFGIGYRQIVPGAFFGSDAILGVYGFVDARHSEYNNMFYQGSLGAELITERFEFRVNGYLPSGSEYVVGTAPGGGVTLNGRDIVYSNGNLVERALPGFDVEAGVKIDFSEAAIRLNAGYFRFERGDTVVEGPRFRAEVEIDDPFGWDGAKLSIGGEIRDDKVRGTEASGLVRLRVPIGGPGKSELADRQLSDLEKLMTRRINRDEDVVAPIVRKGNSAGTGAVTDAMSGETLQAFFVANTAQGAADCSSVANACDFATAQGLAGAGDTFLPIDIAGVIGSVFTLNGDRQQVIGAGGSGQAVVQLSDGSGSFLVVGNLGGRPIMTGINMGHFADTRVAGIATNGAAGISGNGMTGTIRVDDVVLNNGGLDFGSSGAAINVSGATISSGTEDGIRLDHLTGSATFSDTRISTTSGHGVRMSASGGASVTFANGLDIDTTTGTGLNASGGGTLSVGASGADESITSTAGQAVRMSGVNIGAAGMTFDSITSTGSVGAGIEVTGVGGGTFTVSGPTTISGSAGPGINLSGNSAGFNFSGATGVTMTAAAAGVAVSGATGGTIVLADLDIALQSAGATGLDLSGATLNANLTATDFDVTSTSTVGTTGVDLSGTMGAGIVRLGDLNVSGGSATIVGVNTGVQFTAATNATLVFGDGEGATDKGSSISAVTAIAGGSTVTLGSYDFDDVNFTGTLDFTASGSQNLVFVGYTATGDGSGSSVTNLANVVTADAIGAADTTFVLVNDGSAIDDADGFTLATGQTMASFGNGRTFTATGLVIPANFSGVPGAGTTIIDPTGNGAATLTNSGAGDTLTASGTVNLQDFILSNAAGGDGLTASGATTVTATGITIQNVGGQGIDLDNLTGPASTFDNTVVSTTTGNGVDIVNSNVNFTGGLDIDTTSGTGFSASGGGTISVVSGAQPNSVTSTAGQAIDIDGISGNLGFNTLSSTGAAGEGVAIANFGGGSTFTVSGATTINTPGDDGIDLNSVFGTVSFAGPVTIVTPADDGIDIQDSSNGAISFLNTVTISDAGDNGVEINGFNAGPSATGLILFTGLLDIDRSGDIGINIFDRVGTIGFGNVDIDTTGVGGVVVGAAQLDGLLSFAQLDVNGGPASQVGLGIAGGTTGMIDVNGGTIENIAGEAIGLLNSNVTFTYTGTVTQSAAGGELVLVEAGDTSNVTFEAGSVLQATSGPGLQFSNADGTYNFQGTGTLNGGNAGIDIVGGSSGTFTFGANTTITSPAGQGINISGSAANVTYDGTVTQNNAFYAVSLSNNTGGSVTFGGLVTANTATANGIHLVNNGGVAVAFNGGLNVDTTSGTGFNATGGGTVSVAATAGDESIASASGQALNLDGVTIGGGGFNLDSVASSGSAGSGVAFTDVTGGAFAVSGATTVGLGTGVGAAGIDFAGNNTAAFTFGATTITNVGAAVNQTGIDFSGATLGGAVNFASVAISGPTTSTTSIGVNLTGVLGNQIVNLGTQANPASGPSSSITDLHRGVVIDNTAAVQFTFGDGESGSDRGSSINVNGQAGAFTVDAGGGTLAASSFDFNDVNFGAGDTANLPVGNAPVFVSAGGGLITAGTNNLNQDVTTITVAAAELQGNTGQTFVFVGGAGGTLDLSGGGVDGFTLGAGQSVVSFNDGNAISLGVTQPVNLEGNFGITGVTANNVTVSNSAVGATSVINTTGGGSNTISSFDISTGATGILINGNTGAVTVTNVGIAGVAGAGTGVSIQGAQAAVGLNDVDISDTATGIDNQLGTAAGDVTVDAASSITNTTTIAVNLDQNASDFGFAGTISETDASGAGIAANQQGGAVSFTGPVALNTGTSNGVVLTTNTGSVSFGDALNIDTTSGTGFSATGGGTVSVAATAGDQSIATATGQALVLNGVAIGAAGLNFDTVQVSTGGAGDGIGIDTVNTAGGGIAIGSATLAGHTGTAIDLDAISGAGGFSLISADIDLGGATAVGVDIGGANGTISIGTGTSNAVMGLNIDGGQTGIRIGQTAGTVNLGTSATGVVQIGATSRPTEQALRINVDSAGTINVGNTTNQSRLDANLNGIFSAFADATTTFTNLRTATSASTTVLINDDDAVGETNFVGGLQVESTGGGGIALNTARVSVASAPGLNSLTASANGTGLILSGTTIGAAGLHFDTVNLSGTGTGINISGGVTGGDIVLGDVDINPTAGAGIARAISISGGLTNLTIADFDAALQQDDIGLQVTGALGGTISFGDFDIVSASPTGTVGIDIAGATGGTIQIGDTNTNGGENVTLGSGANPLAIGVRVDGTTNTTFTIGDGDGTSGDLTASDIHATTAISGTLPTNGTYNFRDIDFNASGTSNLTGPSIYYVDAAGAGSGGSQTDAGSIAGAESFTGDVIALIDTTQNTSSDAINMAAAPHVSGGAANSLDLDDGQVLISLSAGQSIDLSTLGVTASGAPVNFLFTGLATGTSTLTGAATLDSVAPTLTTNNGNTVNLAGSAAIQGVTLANTGTGDGVNASFGTGESVIIRSSNIGGGTGGDAIDIATTAGASTFDFSNLTLSSGLRLDGTGGGTLTGTTTGTNTINTTGGIALSLNAVAIGAGGSSFDAVTSTDSGTDGIFLNQLSGGSLTITTATINGADDQSIEIANTANAIEITNAAANAGANSATHALFLNNVTTLNLGTGAGGFTSAINAASIGISIQGASGTLNIGTGSTAATGGVFIDTTSTGIVISDNTSGTINIGNTLRTSSISTGVSSFYGNAISVENADAAVTVSSVNVVRAGGGIHGSNLGAHGVRVIDNDANGSFVLNGTNTINNVGADGIYVSGASVDISGVTIGATNNPGRNGVTVADGGQNIEVSLSNITVADAVGAGITVDGSGAGSITVRGFAGNNVTDAGAGGILFDTVTFDSDAGTAGNQDVSFGTVTIGALADRVEGKGLSFLDPTGSVSLTALDIFNNNGTGLEVNTKGAGTTFNLSGGGSGTVNTTNGTALFLDPLSMNLTFGTVTATGGTNGVFIEEGDASGGAGANALTIGTLNITGSTGAGLVIENSTGTFNFGATTIDNTATAGGGVDIDATAGSGDTLNVNFTGGLDIDTASGTGFDANVFVSSTFNLQVANAGTETINTTTGRVLDLLNTNATGSGINFDSLTATGVVSGDVVSIDLDSGILNGGVVNIAGTAASNQEGITIGGLAGAVVNFTSATIDDVQGYAISKGDAVNATFTTVDIDGGNRGIGFSGSGTLTVNGGSIGATTSTTNSAFESLSGSGTANIAASLTKSTSGNLVLVGLRTGGTINLSGNLSATGAATGINVFNNTSGTVTFSGATKTLNTGANAAVNLTSNAGATVNFTGGGLDIDTTSGTGFTATGGGTINVTGAANNIDTATGRGLLLNGVTVGGSGVSFANVRASGTTAANFVDILNVTGGNLSVASTTALGVTGTGISISGSSAAFTFNHIDIGDDTDPSPAMTYGINLDGNTGGSFTTTVSSIIDYARTAGIRIANSGAGFSADFQGQIEARNQNSAAYTSGGDGLVLASNNAGTTINLASFVFTDRGRGAGNAGGQGIVANNGGQLTISAGNVTTENILGVDTASIDIRNTATNVTLTSVFFRNGDAGETGGGLHLEDNTGTFEIQSITGISTINSSGIFADNAGTLTIGGGSVFSNGRAAVDIRNMAVNLTLSGIESYLSTGNGVNFNNVSGTVNVSGNTRIENSANAGLNIVGNSGTFNFTGGFDYTGTTATALNAGVGGILTVGGTGNVIQTTTGTGVYIAGTTIGAAGITLESVSTNGAVNGIVLNTTGGVGGLTITGDGSTPVGRGSNNSGGQILNSTGSGILLMDTRNVSLAHMNITDAADHGIDALRVNGFSGSYLTLNSNGNANQEHGIRIRDAAGVYDFTKLSADGNFDAHIRVLQQTGANSLTSFTVNDSLFQNVTTGTFEDGILFEMQTNTSVGTLTIQNSNFNNHDGDHIQVALNGSASIGTTTINNNALTATGTNLSGGLTVNHADTFTGTHTVNITNNNIQGATAASINVNVGSHQAPAVVSATITGNVIGTAGVAGSGGYEGINVEINGLPGVAGGVLTALIDNNTVREWGFGNGIRVLASDGAAGNISTLNATITRNTVIETTNLGFSAVSVDVNNGNAVCLDLGGATVENTLGSTSGTHIALRILASGGTIGLEDYGGTNNNTALIEDYLQDRNSGVPPVGFSLTGGSVQAGGACPVP
ncbi:MAG: inverse autotransporter beta domain-containing protein [Hoeflea sp.]|uniref:inverse autotransporter beta domain-containing protein n=1 Tax=Hoeflea sp. TaxID=1940281 RepID=UPI0032ED178E